MRDLAPAACCILLAADLELSTVHREAYVPNDKRTREDFDKGDTNGDGKIDMEEWLSTSFHEMPQNPIYNANGEHSEHTSLAQPTIISRPTLLPQSWMS